MKVIRYLFLTTLLTIGFIIPSCDGSLGGVDCNCEGSRYFDVQNLDSWYYSNSIYDRLGTAVDSIDFAEFGGVILKFDSDYHAQQIIPKIDWTIALMPSALACSCAAGYKGSKTESLIALEVVTKNDFDLDHPAGSRINDLVEVFATGWGPLDEAQLVDDYVNSQEGNIAQEDIALQLTKAPSMDALLELEIHLKLSEDEEYTVSTRPITIF